MDQHDAQRPDLPARIPSSSTAVPAAWNPGVGADDAAASGINLRVLIRGMLRHWKLILAIWLVGAATLVVAVQALIKPSYEAFATILVEPAADDLFNNATRLRDDPDTFLKTQVDLIRSPNVLVAALDSPSVAGLPMVTLSTDAETELRKKLLVTINPGTYLIRVSLSSTSANEAARIVNAVGASYLKSAQEWADSTTQKQIRDLTNYHEELKAQEQSKQQELTALADKGNVDLPNLNNRPGGRGEAPVAGMQAITIETYRSVQSNLLTTQLDLIEAESILQQRQLEARATGRREPSNAEVDAIFVNDADVRQIRSQIQAANDQYDLIRKRMAKGNDPSARAAKLKLESLKEQYTLLWERKEPQIRAQLSSGGADASQTLLAEAQRKVEALRAKKVAFTKVLGEIIVDNRQKGGDTVRAQLLTMDLDGLRDMSQSVLRRLEGLKFESRGGARITMIHNARPPRVPVSDLRMKLLAAGPAGLLAGLVTLFALLEVRAARVTDPDEVSTRVRVRAFALPPLPVPGGPGGRRGRDHAERLAQFIQGVEHLRVALCGDGTGEKGRCVMVTSAAGGEGKTTLAAQLAGRCAAAGMSTLLIDCDLRRPSLGELLEVPEGVGLAEVLSGRATAEDALVVIDSGGGFHLLPAGSPVTDPGRLLQPHRIGPLLDRLRRSFDVVIIDTSPVLPVPDALCLGRCVDGAILATRFDTSRYPLVERANRRLAEAGIPVLGLVVNGVKSFGSQYNSYGGYAYAHVDPAAVESRP